MNSYTTTGTGTGTIAAEVAADWQQLMIQ